MEKSCELLEKEIEVIESLLENPRLSTARGQEIAGDYWSTARDDLAEHCKADYGREFISCICKDKLLSYKAQCNDEIKRIKNERYDRKLRNRDHRMAIIANIIAVLAFILSIFAATGIPQVWFKNLRIYIGLEE